MRIGYHLSCSELRLHYISEQNLKLDKNSRNLSIFNVLDCERLRYSSRHTGRTMARNHKKGYEGKIAGLYDIEETIGTGHFAVVKLARHVFTGEKVAVKVIDKTKLDEISKAHLFQEVRCMKLVQHPHVVRLYEVIDTQTKLYLILELGDGGDMYDYIMKHETGIEEMLSKRYFKQIVTAISYCHQLHVVHRDLKPENVVFFPKLGAVKLTDFGFSNKFIPGTKLETSCGSLAYSAPEILLGDSYDAPAVDVWSLGVLLFMLVCGVPPFQEANDSETLTRILDCKYKMPIHVSPELQDLIDKMLRREPNARILLDQIINHPWLSSSPEIDASCHMPLVSREHLSDSDHNLIIDRMAEGKIASREEIVSSLEQNSYNHITATYYLLAERRLKKYHDAIDHQNMRPMRMNSAPAGTKPSISPLSLAPRLPMHASADTEESPFSMSLKSLVSPVAPQAPRQFETLPEEANSTVFQLHRKFSLIREESEDSEASESKDHDIDMEVRHVIKQVKSIEDDVSSNKSTGEVNMSMGSLSLRRGVPSRPLRSVSSSPQLLNMQLLNQICEEGESDDEDDDILAEKLSSPRWIHSRNSIASPEMIRKFQNRKKRLHAKSRTGTSCSSSDASDTDESDTRKRKQKLKSQLHRRDSSDHSSDTDGPGNHGPSGGGRWGGGGSGHQGGGGGRGQKDKDRDDDRNESSKRRKSGGNMKGGKQQSVNVDECNHKNCDEKSESQGRNGLIYVEPQRNLSKKDSLKSSNLSLTSNISNLSLSSRGSKYIMDPCSNTPRILTDRSVDSHNVENRIRNMLMQDKPKDFSDINESDNDEKYDCGKDYLVRKIHSSGVIRKCSKDKIKSDINSNGMVPGAKSLDKSISRCCSVV